MKYAYATAGFLLWIILCDLSFHFKYSNYSSQTVQFISDNMEFNFGLFMGLIISIVLLIFLLTLPLKKTQKDYKFLFVILAIGGILFFSGVLFKFPEKLFGINDNNIGEFLKLIGLGVGGCGAIWGLMINNNRVKEQTKQNEIAERGQINTRFKDAAQLLASDNTSTILSGIHALHQIALESSKDSKMIGFVYTIRDIFQSYIEENSYIIANDLMITDGGNNKKTIIIQTIVEVLFRSDVYNIFEIKNSSFININLGGIKFTNNFTNVYFDKCIFSDTSFDDIKLKKVTISNAETGNIYSSMRKVKLKQVAIYKCDLDSFDFISCHFSFSKIENTTFYFSNFSDLTFFSSEIINTVFFKTDFIDIDFDDEIKIIDCQFTECKPEEIIKNIT